MQQIRETIRLFAVTRQAGKTIVQHAQVSKTIFILFFSSRFHFGCSTGTIH